MGRLGSRRNLGAVAGLVLGAALALPFPRSGAVGQYYSTPECPRYVDGILDIVGTAGNDVLVADRDHQAVCGLGGNDTLRVGSGLTGVFLDGGAGDDIICGRNGSPTALRGGIGIDRERSDSLDTVGRDIEATAPLAPCS